MASTTDANNIVTKKSTATKAALNNRREMCYANEITGKGNDGNLSMKIKLAYTAPTMSTLPIIVLLAVYMNVYYEKLGASLTYIRYVVPDPDPSPSWFGSPVSFEGLIFLRGFVCCFFLLLDANYSFFSFVSQKKDPLTHYFTFLSSRCLSFFFLVPGSPDCLGSSVFSLHSLVPWMSLQIH